MHVIGNNIYKRSYGLYRDLHIFIYVPMLLILHYIDIVITMQDHSLNRVHIYDIKTMDMLFPINI